MAGLTLTQAEAQLAAWVQASTDLAERGQSSSIKGRSLTRADAREVRESIKFWQSMCERLGRDGGIQRRRVINT